MATHVVASQMDLTCVSNSISQFFEALSERCDRGGVVDRCDATCLFCFVPHRGRPSSNRKKDDCTRVSNSITPSALGGSVKACHDRVGKTKMQYFLSILLCTTNGVLSPLFN